MKDLLRVMRNKRHHFLEFSTDMQSTMGPMPEGFLLYFEERFPSLLMHCVKVLTLVLAPEPGSKAPKEKIYVEYLESLYSLFASNVVDVKKFNAAPGVSACVGVGSQSGEGGEIDSPGLQDDYGGYGAPTLDAAVALAGSSGRRGRQWFLAEEEWAVQSFQAVNGGGASTSSSSSSSALRSFSQARPSHLTRSSTDMRYRSRLCTHWEATAGASCPMRKKGKCDFAHGPLELRIKETRRERWLTNLYNARHVRGDWQGREGEMPRHNGHEAVGKRGRPRRRP